MTGREDLTAEELTFARDYISRRVRLGRALTEKMLAQLEHQEKTISALNGEIAFKDTALAELAKLREANRVWTVGERKPKFSKWVLVWRKPYWVMSNFTSWSMSWSDLPNGATHKANDSDCWREMLPPPGEKVT